MPESENGLLLNSVTTFDKQGKTQLAAGKCPNCQVSFFPAPDVCAVCMGSDLTREFLSPKGRLYSFTSVEVAPASTPHPYILGYVDFPEGVRVLGRVESESLSTLQLDMEVEVRVDERKSSDGEVEVNYVFVPTGEAS